MEIGYNLIENRKIFDVTAFVTAYYFARKPSFEPCWEEYDFSQIFFVLAGNGTYTTESGSYPIRPGQMLYRPAGKRSRYEWHTEKVSFAIISFVCRSEAMSVFEGAPFALNEDESATLLDVMKTGARICEGIGAGEALRGMRVRSGVPDVVLDFLYASLERFLCLCYCRRQGIDLLQDESRKVSSFMRETTLVTKVCDYVATHLSEPITIRTLCETFWVSPTTLMKKFRAEMGQGINEYVTDLRIKEAKLRIAKSDQSFTAISEALGFSSVTYFSKVFKAKTGRTPTEYSKYASKRRAGVLLGEIQQKTDDKENL